MRPQRIDVYSLIIRTTTITLLALASGCSQDEQPQAKLLPSTPSTPVAATSPVLLASAKAQPSTVTPQAASPQSDLFEQAEDKAAGATIISQSAKSKDDWSLAASQWQSAIALLQNVPPSDPKKALAQKMIVQYQTELASAKQHAVGGLTKTVSVVSSPSPKVASKPKNAPPKSPSPTVASKPKNASPKPPSPTVASKPKNASSKPSSSTVASKPKTRSIPAPAVLPEMALASHLKRSKAIMYGTYWCPYCNRQKQMFGSEAFSQITYVECDAGGPNPRPDLCIKAGVRSFPTWQINGQLYQGMLSLQDIADISGYQGDRNFSI